MVLDQSQKESLDSMPFNTNKGTSPRCETAIADHQISPFKFFTIGEILRINTQLLTCITQLRITLQVFLEDPGAFRYVGWYCTKPRRRLWSGSAMKAWWA